MKKYILFLTLCSTTVIHATKQEFKSATPKAIEHFKAISAIRSLYYDLLEDLKNKHPENDIFIPSDLKRRKKVSLSPHEYQTNKGLILNLHCGFPTSLHTPCGDADLSDRFGSMVLDGKGWKEFNKKFLDALGATLYQKYYIGVDAYKISKIGSIQLPDPQIVHEECLSLEQWRKLHDELEEALDKE